MVGWCHDQPQIPLLRLCGNIVNDVASLRLHIVSLQVSDGWNVGMSGLAVVALVVVVGQDLPIVVPVHLPGVVKDVVIEVEVFILLLGITPSKVILPVHLRRVLGVEVDPNEAVVIYMGVNAEQPILGLVETLKLLVARRLRQVSAEAIRPAVVSVDDLVSSCRFKNWDAQLQAGWIKLYSPAREYHRGALLLMDDGIGAVPADIVKSINGALAITSYDEIEASDLKIQPVACVGDSDLVGDELPPAREDGTPLQLVHLLGGVPASRQGTDGGLVLCGPGTVAC